MKKRLDHLLVELNLVKSRSQALRLIREHCVTVDNVVVDKPSKQVHCKSQIEIDQVDRFVGRGGEKLAAALDEFRIDVTGKRCLDVGASTGGFTDCLLQNGASSVLAIDVGHGQLDRSLREDPRVRSLEKINARYLEPVFFGHRFEVIVTDVSFISLTLVLPGIVAQAAVGCDLIALIKPQFELSSDALDQRGIVRDAEMRKDAVEKVKNWFDMAVGWTVQGIIDSPIEGGDGNREFLIYAKQN